MHCLVIHLTESTSGFNDKIMVTAIKLSQNLIIGSKKNMQNNMLITLIVFVYSYGNYTLGTGSDEKISPLDWKVTGRNLSAMLFIGSIFYVLTILIEYKFFVKPRFAFL